MDNQHKKIKGYNELTQETIDSMNEIKVKAAEVGELILKLNANGADPRWSEAGALDLQKGFMSLTRSVAKPDFF